MLPCPRCGKKNTDHAPFCAFCGGRIHSVPSSGDEKNGHTPPTFQPPPSGGKNSLPPSGSFPFLAVVYLMITFLFLGVMYGLDRSGDTTTDYHRDSPSSPPRTPSRIPATSPSYSPTPESSVIPADSPTGVTPSPAGSISPIPSPTLPSLLPPDEFRVPAGPITRGVMTQLIAELLIWEDNCQGKDVQLQDWNRKETLFSDIDVHHPNYAAITYLTERGIIEGFDDLTYRPAEYVTRYEFGMHLMRVVALLERDIIEDRKNIENIKDFLVKSKKYSEEDIQGFSSDMKHILIIAKKYPDKKEALIKDIDEYYKYVSQFKIQGNYVYDAEPQDIPPDHQAKDSIIPLVKIGLLPVIAEKNRTVFNGNQLCIVEDVKQPLAMLKTCLDEYFKYGEKMRKKIDAFSSQKHTDS